MGDNTRMDAFFNRVWASRGVVAWLLWPGSLLFGGLVRLRRMLYAKGLLKVHRLPVPVLVVGNVRVGGGGKSPTVLALVRHLQQRGWAVAIVSRGYGRRGDVPDVLEVKPDTDVTLAGDEPLMLARQSGVPVFVGANRVQAAKRALQVWPQTQVLIADDGLQHLALGRDVEVVVHSGAGLGNGFMLPAGPLREPWPREADVVLDTAACRELADEAVTQSGRIVPLSSLLDQPVCAVAGIAHPDAFFQMLRGKGLNLAQVVALPDHDDFSHWATARSGLPADAVILCTEKDAPKLWGHEPNALAVQMRLNPPDSFFEQIDASLARLSTSGPKTAAIHR